MRPDRYIRHALVPLAIAFIAPGAAMARPRLGISTVFGDAAPSIQIMMLALVVAALAAVIVAVLKLASGRRLAGGSSFVSALRLGGPLIGLLGAVLNLLAIFIGIANTGADVPMAVLAPGFAEAAMVFVLGLFAGVVAVICHWMIEARIDRAVLSS